MRAIVINRNECLRMIDRFCSEVGPTFPYAQLITIKRFKAPRTDTQNSKCHAMIRELAQEIGYSDSELKDWFKWEFGAKKALFVNGKERLIPTSTLDYNKSEMSDFIGQIERIGAEMGFRFSHEPAEAR